MLESADQLRHSSNDDKGKDEAMDDLDKKNAKEIESVDELMNYLQHPHRVKR